MICVSYPLNNINATDEDLLVPNPNHDHSSEEQIDSVDEDETPKDTTSDSDDT
jgi:hypothetical protein